MLRFIECDEKTIQFGLLNLNTVASALRLNGLGFFFYSTGPTRTRMGIKKLAIFLLVLCLCLEGASAKEKGAKKGKKKGKQVYCPS